MTTSDVPYRTGDPDQDCTLATLHTLAVPDDDPHEYLHTLHWTPQARVGAELLGTSRDWNALTAQPTSASPHIDIPFGDLDNPRIGVALVVGAQVFAADVCGRTYIVTPDRWFTRDIHGARHGTPGAHPGSPVLNNLSRLALAHHEQPLVIAAPHL